MCTVTYPAATVAGVTSRFAVKNEYNAAGYLAKIWRHDLALTKPFWTGTSMNADGNFTGDSMGTSAADLTTVRDFDPLTGRMKAIKAGLAGATNAQFNRYVYDHLGNVTERHDDNMNVHETFTMDALSRLTQTNMTGATTQTKTYQYDPIGNLTYKSDLGTLTYPAPTAPRPHGVTTITGNAAGVLDGVTSGTYLYDGNGNMVSSAQINRTYTYTSFNLPSQISNQGSASNFIYDADHNRISESYVNGTIIYVNPGNVTFFERHKNFNQAGYEIHRYFVHTPSGTTIFFSRQSNNGAQAPRFQLKDNLGSTVADVDSTGNVVTRYSFDAFGKTRNPNGSAAGGTISESRRGFTGHEHVLVGNSGIIHMNGRTYDATLGRFAQPDPIVQFAGFSQSYNRYSYTLNNPLRYTDPSGFGLRDLFRAVDDLAHDVFNAQKVYAVVRNRPDGGAHDRFMQSHSWARAIGYVVAGYYGGSYATAQIAGYEAYIVGGANTDIWRAAAISYGTSEAFSAVGTASSEVGGFWGGVIKIGGSAAIGCVSADASGGSCRQGALFAGGFAAADTFFQYATIKTDNLKQTACNANLSVCERNAWDELRTDGARETDWSRDPDPEHTGNALTNSGMAREASGQHMYDPGGIIDSPYLARAVNHVSKIHDFFNSWNYSSQGLYMSRGVMFDSVFQLYSFSGMPVAGMLTAAHYIGGNPALLAGQLEARKRRLNE